ncbi:MAG: HD-GYP domain-containing protein, partial [Candidatus Omnitrophica bacterium]|nr:HD-GYP domain-containing protein [Candidatus Omnitrophota bacterium]
ISGHTFHLIDLIFRQIKEKGGNIISDAQILSEHDDNSDLDRIMSGVSIKRVHRKLERLIKRINQTTLETIYALVETMRAKDSYTQEHSMSMVLYAEEMGRILGLPERDIENLKLGAMLHDIGKVGISDKILQKKGPLTEGEFGIIKKHPLIGAEIVRRVHFLKDVVPILLHHHEAFDGTGYVGHLKGEEIPLLARITSIVDVYQALISKRSYRRAYNQEEAIDILKKESRTKFDPSLVEIFIKLVSSKANK